MIIVIVGPTGVGKTKLSEELSVKCDAIIINADSKQVYKGMDIGTAKYTKDEDLGKEHYLFDIVSPNESYSVYDYQRDLRKIIEENKKRNIIIVGGTGLYIKAGLYDYKFLDRIGNNYDELTNDDLYELIKKRGLENEVHHNNRVRMISKLNSSGDKFGKDVLLYDNVIFIGLTTDRDNLYSILDKRVDKLIEKGLLEEVKMLYQKYGLTKALTSSIGYKELIAYLKGLMTLGEAINLIKLKTRKYAKRQYTWINNQMNVMWFNVNYENFNNTIKEIITYIEGKK